MSLRNLIGGPGRYVAIGAAAILVGGCGSSGSTKTDTGQAGQAPAAQPANTTRGGKGKPTPRPVKSPNPGIKPAEGSPQNGRKFTRADAQTYMRKRLRLIQRNSKKGSPKSPARLRLGTCSGGGSIWNCDYTVRQGSVRCNNSARVGYEKGRFHATYKASCKGGPKPKKGPPPRPADKRQFGKDQQKKAP